MLFNTVKSFNDLNPAFNRASLRRLAICFVIVIFKFKVTYMPQNENPITKKQKKQFNVKNHVFILKTSISLLSMSTKLCI